MCRVRFKAKERYTAIADSRARAWKGWGDGVVQPARRISKQGRKRQYGYDIIADSRTPWHGKVGTAELCSRRNVIM